MKIVAEYANKMTREEYLDLLALDEGPGYMTRSDIVEIAKNAIEFADSHPVSPWRSVKEELPEKDGLYLTRFEIKDRKDCCRYDVEWFIDGYFQSTSALDGRYTHWMPIPELPKEKEDAE